VSQTGVLFARDLLFFVASSHRVSFFFAPQPIDSVLPHAHASGLGSSDSILGGGLHTIIGGDLHN
jgi:hypothetical protein